MTMHAQGLTKLMEELGELTQIAAKKSAFMDTDEHPDGNGSMRERLECEMGDVMAAIGLVSETLGLSQGRIQRQCDHKTALFRKWHAAPDTVASPH